VTIPAELVEAQAIDGWCRAYGTLPFPGALLEQPAHWWLDHQAVLALGADAGDSVPATRPAPFDPLVNLPMETLSGLTL
jgi:hypothetical protein